MFIALFLLPGGLAGWSERLSIEGTFTTAKWDDENSVIDDTDNNDEKNVNENISTYDSNNINDDNSDEYGDGGSDVYEKKDLIDDIEESESVDNDETKAGDEQEVEEKVDEDEHEVESDSDNDSEQVNDVTTND